jgi:hypothetical protein
MEDTRAREKSATTRYHAGTAHIYGERVADFITRQKTSRVDANDYKGPLHDTASTTTNITATNTTTNAL